MLYDRDIREPLFDFLEEAYPKVRIIEEKNMGRSRADLIMVLPGELIGIEIKSDADSYTRLNRQVRDYDTYFDRNYVVVGTTHAFHIEEHVPPWWGIITVEEVEQTADFYILRRADRNPDMDPKHKLSLLWRPELANIQKISGMPAYKEKSKAFVIGKIISFLSSEKLNSLITEELFERDYNQIAETIRSYKIEKGVKTNRKAKAGKKRRKKKLKQNNITD